MEEYSTSTFPYDDVVLIEAPDPSERGYYIIGSGVVIGPHTILTATHVVDDTSAGIADQDIKLYPGWNSADPALGAGNISTTYTDHFNDISTDAEGDLYQSQSASDYAVIDTSYTFSSWMDVLLNYPGGDVHVTGYPASAGGYQTDSVGTVSADPSYSVLDYGTLSVSPGNSGGPLWLDYDGSDDVVGIVSTSGWAVQLTSADWSQIEGWVGEDGYSLEAQSTSVVPVATAASAATVANILWRNSNGDVELWNANGAGGFTGQDLGVVDLSWQIEGTGDFNGAAEDGILWRNSGGDVELWNSNGSGGFTGQNLGVVDLSWQIEGTGDFNGKAEDGILWRNTDGDVSFWNSNGSGGFTGQDLGVVGSSWQIEGTGDFNGDGADGILWRNSDGDVELWNANGSGGFTGQELGVVGSSWQIEGTGDFNGSERDGILWRNTDGDVYLWNANASGSFTGQDLGVVGSSWQIEGTGDFNGSGRDGILWRNMDGGCLPLERQCLWGLHRSGFGRCRFQLADFQTGLIRRPHEARR